MTRSAVIWSLAFTAIAIAIGLSTLFLYIQPMVTVELVAMTDGSLQLDVSKTFKSNSLRGASISDQEGKPLWKSDFGPTPPTEVSIRLHDGQPADDGQLLRQLRVGEEISLRIEYQYDSLIPPAPCIAESEYRFTIANDGSVEYRGIAD